MSAEALIILIRNPEPGKVKTRLARSLGDQKAYEIYLRLLAHTRRVALQVDCDRLLYYSSRIDHHDDWPENAFSKFLQKGQDIGERMLHALSQSLQAHSKAVLIGSDIATLHSGILREAFARLEDHAYVIGPAKDGGYYLIGMKKAEARVFSDIPWSTAAVFETTRKRLQELGASFYVLPEMADIDTAADWEKYKDFLQEPRS